LLTIRLPRHSPQPLSSATRPAPLPSLPPTPLVPGSRIHVSGICGTGTGSLACLLTDMGMAVRGSDDHVYPPMSDYLAARQIEVRHGYAAANLADRPDWVVIGNALSRDNPEATAARDLGLSTTSFAAALEQWVLPGRLSIVVAGTHGKTTTTTLTAHLLCEAGLDPGWLIGGIPCGLPGPSHLGAGTPFVTEGDEYDTAYFDKGSKFLHYRPRICILTSVELDHLDIFADQAAVDRAFGQLLALLPADGLLVACGDDPGVRRVVAATPPACAVVWYGLRPGADVRPRAVVQEGMGRRFDLTLGDTAHTFHLPMSGDHNVANATGALLAAHRAGADPTALTQALSRFAGIRRRQEVVAEVAGITLIDDFAHHPTAVAVTLDGLAHRYPGRRLWAVFEFRSASAIRRCFESAYASALAHADRVVLPPILRHHRLTADQLLDPQAVARALNAAGTPARAFAELDGLVTHLQAELHSEDVVVVMSSGGFDGLLPRLTAVLAHRSPPRNRQCDDYGKGA